MAMNTNAPKDIISLPPSCPAKRPKKKIIIISLFFFFCPFLLKVKSHQCPYHILFLPAWYPFHFFHLIPSFIPPIFHKPERGETQINK